MKYLEQFDYTGKTADLSYIDHCQFMGMAIRKRDPVNRSARDAQ